MYLVQSTVEFVASSLEFTNYTKELITYLQVTLDAKQKSILEKWQTGDLKLYNHYKDKFEKMVSKCENGNL